ncbi:MAG: DNA polymerase III subunit gamma/tau [Clostridiales Family XIII bacterium]|jgi:DNA polymerase-3 subunit gamma/tau|nr:DNA polymerase III subunit gamma/tau [Clostridiales Family XIII bacterium]
MGEQKGYIAIYRRFRPETFDEVLGQQHVVRVLRNQIHVGNVGHAYLFSGTRGTGKTTIARLLAKGVNCLNGGSGQIAGDGAVRPCGICEHCVEIKNGVFVDVAEIDAASNNSVDDVRDLRELLVYPPQLGRKRVFIFDEVHEFSKQAFNALLKTLEEPPPNVLFILCTTEPNKLPQTILSRCQRFDFRRVAASEIAGGMKAVSVKLGIDAADDALALLAQNADGSVRDGMSLLEQCVTSGDSSLTRELVLDVLGSPGDSAIAALTDAVHVGRTAEALVKVNEMLAEGKEERRVIEEWIDWLHSALLIKFVKDPRRIISRSAENIDEIGRASAGYSVEFINDSIYRLSKLFNDSRWSPHVRVLLEIAIVEMSKMENDGSHSGPAPGA